MNNLFNTTFEISIRVLLLLSKYHQPISFERILVTDFITTYGCDFEISDTNLNGDNSYRFSEFIARRELIQRAIKKLVLQGLIQPSKDNLGFVYELSNDGKQLIPKFVSVYAEKYIQTANNTVEYLQGKSETELLKEINKRSQPLEGE